VTAGTATAGTLAAGTGGVAGTGAAGTSDGGAGTGAPPDAGTAGADAAVVCVVPDDVVVSDDDADGGLDPSCQNVTRTIIAESCIGGICHHSGKFQAPAGGLDLMSPCVADRLIKVGSRCQGLVYIDPAQPEKSFLLNKLEAETPICGEPMPWTGHLPPEQVRCMNAWVHALARSSK
jgi:hypothetical protein